MQTELITLEVSMKAPPSKLRLAVSDSNRADTQLSDTQLSGEGLSGSEVVAKTAGELLRSDALRSHIETQLKIHGDPLRWSITHINLSSQTAYIEAVVTTL